MCRKLSFCNGNPYPCGCSAKFSSGGGEYSDAITVNLCEKHALPSDPEEDAKEQGYYNSAGGNWVNTVDMLIAAVKKDITYDYKDTALANLRHLQEELDRIRKAKDD